LKNDKSLEKYM